MRLKQVRIMMEVLKMKNSLLAVFSGLSLLGMTACGETTSEDGMSVKEILNKSISTMESLDSYSMTMDMSQVMNMGEEEGMAFDSTADLSLTMDPMTMKQTTKMDMGDLGMGEEGDFEYLSYFTEKDGFFVEEPGMGQWLKLPENMMSDMLAMSDTQLSPEEQLKPFMDYTSNLSVDTMDDSYIITLSGDGVDMEEFMAQMSGMGIEGMDPMLSEMMGDIDIQSLNYEIVIDKDTFYQIESNIDMTISMDIMGESIRTEQTIHMNLSEFNAVNPIEVPQDVLENAEEMSEEDMMGGGF